MSLSAVSGDWPLSSGGTLIGTEASALPSPTAYTAAYGVDLRSVTFSDAAFASNNFQVAGSGTVSGSAYNFGGIGRNTTVSNVITSNTGNDPASNDRAIITLQNTAGTSSSDSSITFATNNYGVSGGVRVTIDKDGNLINTAAVRLAKVTVSLLPASSSTIQGSLYAVTDGAAGLAWGATVTGGGSTYYVVTCNGSNWTVMGK